MNSRQLATAASAFRYNSLMLTWLDNIWVVWPVAGMLLLVGAYVLYRALLWDRPRGWRRCPRCGYDMRGTPGLRCSECGFDAGRERQLHRTGRYWRMAAAGCMFVLAAGALYLTPQIRRDGWLSIVPTDVLLWFVPMAYEHHAPVSVVPQNPPITHELSSRTLSDHQWRYLFQRKGIIRTRDRWPVDVPFHFEVHDLSPWTVSAKPESVFTAAGQRVRYSSLRSEYGRTFIAAESRSVRFNCAVGPLTSMTNTWTGVADIPVTAVAHTSDAIQARSSPELLRLLRDNTAVVVRRMEPDDETPHWAAVVALIWIALEPGAWPDDVSLCVRWDLMHRGESVAWSRIHSSLIPACRVPPGHWISNGSARRGLVFANDPADALFERLSRTEAYFHMPTMNRPAWLADKLAASDGAWGDWSIRVSSDEELALRDWERDAFWSGEFSLPVQPAMPFQSDVASDGE